MAKSEVSADFKSYFSKKHDQFEKARKAESALVNVPLPIDAEFEAVYVNAKGSVSSAGNPTITFNFSVTEPAEFRGRKVRQLFIINSTEKMSVEDRLAMMFDRLESWGLPREVRTTHESITDIFEWFDSNTPEVKGKVKASSYNQEGKEVTWYTSAKQAPVDGMIGAPVSAPIAAPAASTSSAPFDPTSLTVGTIVEYNGADYVIEKVEGKFADIKSSKTGRVRNEVELSELKPK